MYYWIQIAMLPNMSKSTGSTAWCKSLPLAQLNFCQNWERGILNI